MKRMMMAVLLCLLTVQIFSVESQASEMGIAVGGINILKTDITGNPLEGAVFRIARTLRDGELTDSTVEKTMMKIGEENRIIVLESFWDSREMTGQRQTEAVTDHTGKVSIYGLPYGTYYLIETEAPEGYKRITDPMRLTIHKYSHLTQEDGVQDDQGVTIDNTLHIMNIRYTLPDTGKLKTLQLIAATTGILFSSAALLLLNRRRWK